MFRANLCLAATLLPSALSAQDAAGLHSHTVPLPAPPAASPNGTQEPTDPPARTVQDARTQVAFHLPAGWNLSRTDGELSTFHLDARTAPRRAELRAVANIAFNPYPRSTFSGALFYLSLTPHASAAECLAQTTARPSSPVGSATVADLRFNKGHDAHGKTCTEASDTVYTAMRHGSCLRFDLAINSFCGGEASGALDLTENQLANIQQRLEAILQSVRFESHWSESHWSESH